MERYQDHYRLLGLVPGDSLQKLRGAYKAQMRRWHPDHFGQSESARRQAEEQSKQINRAYQELSEFYERHGKLPLVVTSESTTVSRPTPARTNTVPMPDVASASDWSPPTTNISNRKKGPSKFGTVLLGAFTLLIIGFLLWGPEMTEPARDPSGVTPPFPASIPESSVKPVATSNVPGSRFSYGSTLGEVYTTQGVPTKVDGDVWHYGDARVFFHNGRVARWSDSEPPRLKVKGESDSSPIPIPAIAQFTRGSSKDEVRAVQGTPLRETEEAWDYGLSRIYFDRSGRVSGWQESPLEPLRIKH
jgi:hypothetical protein